MPLHPIYVKLLSEEYRSLGDLPLDGFRRELCRRLIQATPSHPECATRDLFAGLIPSRIYSPPIVSDRSAIIIYFHGGGFVAGNLDTHDGIVRAVSMATGYRILSVDYRLAPEHPFPAAFNDAKNAFLWVRQHADELDVDPESIFVAGDSAGGNLAAGISCALAHDSPRPAGQILFYPVTDHHSGNHESLDTLSVGYGLTKKGIHWFWEQYLLPDTDPDDPRVSPFRGEIKDLPPTFLVTAEFDPLRDEGMAYARKIRSAGTSVRAQCVDGLIHGFLSMAGKIEAVDMVLQNLQEWLHRPEIRRTGPSEYS